MKENTKNKTQRFHKKTENVIEYLEKLLRHVPHSVLKLVSEGKRTKAGQYQTSAVIKSVNLTKEQFDEYNYIPIEKEVPPVDPWKKEVSKSLKMLTQGFANLTQWKEKVSESLEILTKFAAEQKEFNKEQKEFNVKQDARWEKQEKFNVKITDRIDGIDKKLDDHIKNGH